MASPPILRLAFAADHSRHLQNTAVMLMLQLDADAPLWANASKLWVEALRRKAGRDELKALLKSTEADAAKLRSLPISDTASAAVPPPQHAPPVPIGRRRGFQPRT